MINVLIVSIVVAWKFYFALLCKDSQKVLHLNFRQKIAVVLITTSASNRKKYVESTQIHLQMCDLMAATMIQFLASKQCVVCKKNERAKCGKRDVVLYFITAKNLSALKFILLNKLSFVKLLYENYVVLCID